MVMGSGSHGVLACSKLPLALWIGVRSVAATGAGGGGELMIHMVGLGAVPDLVLFLRAFTSRCVRGHLAVVPFQISPFSLVAGLPLR